MTFGEQFLRSPALFPARIAGETFGSASFTLDLPGGPYRIEGLSAVQRTSLETRYGDQRPAISDRPLVQLIVHRVAAEDFLEIDTRGWEYNLDYSSTDSSVSLAGLRLAARLELGRDRAGIWTPVEDPAEFWGVVENVLRPLLALRLLLTGGLLVHSAAVSLDGRGFVFAGRSNAGKSTIARMAVSCRQPVLSDDLNAIVPVGDRFVIAPLPFTGDLEPWEVSRIAVPLAAIIGLEKGTGEALRSISRGEAVSLLVRSAPYVNHDPLRIPLLLDRAAEIAAAASTALLTFRREGDIWPILQSLP
ncbi:MAG TPA: hypothetical protein VGR02_19160 [Thermoanaerobaculia bacterium]|nr:hypothetical protein [Thermoanaerobaculia bacterium]